MRKLITHTHTTKKKGRKEEGKEERIIERERDEGDDMVFT